MVHDDTPRIGLFFARVARQSRPETRVERAPRARGGSTRGRTFREGVVAAKAAILLVMVVKGDGCVRVWRALPDAIARRVLAKTRKRKTPGAREILRRMRARMGTQSESLKPSFTHSKSENATRHRRSQLSIRYFSDARPTETKSRCRRVPECAFPSICGDSPDARRPKVLVRRFRVGGAVLRGAPRARRSKHRRAFGRLARRSGRRRGARRRAARAAAGGSAGRGETRRRCA